MAELFASTILSHLPLWLATALYLWQAGLFVWGGNHAMAVVFCGYSLANIGMIAGTR